MAARIMPISCVRFRCCRRFTTMAITTCDVGQITSPNQKTIWRKSSPPVKNICLPFIGIMWLSPPSPAHPEGRYGQSSRNVRRVAVDAYGAVRRAALAADERNRVVLIPRRWDQVLRDVSQGDGG